LKREAIPKVTKCIKEEETMVQTSTYSVTILIPKNVRFELGDLV
jgi:hypothetical protein